MMLKFKLRNLIYTFCFLTNLLLTAQTHEFVKLTEEKNGKRLDLYAVNTGAISYDVFLHITTEDFRRSSLRPVIKTVPPKSKTKLITLIELANTKGVYQSTFIINEVSYDIALEKDKQNFDLKFNSELNKKQLIIFTETNCNLCDDVKLLLNKNNLKFKEYDINKDQLSSSLLTKTLNQNKINSKTTMPVIQIEDSIYTNLKDSQQLIEIIQNHF
ncbi:glutaredoxin domain-containing protein [Mariniflexile sp.]|uniref:glutaredoxin domain-containing protein n=1 Tax=Mariniflexile sp. TaxID=1979402 RepID=UPI0035642831